MRLPIMLFTLMPVLFTSVLHAALPPLSQDEREEMATDIVSGYVVSVKKTVIDEGNDYSDNHYRVKMIVTKTEKGETGSQGTVEFTFRRINKRPEGWVGPIGQNGIVKQYSMIRAYMTMSEKGFKLLEPNGFDVVK